MATIIEIVLNPILYRKTSLILAETFFLASEKPFFIYQAFQAVKPVFPKENVFFNKFFIPASGNEFFV